MLAGGCTTPASESTFSYAPTGNFELLTANTEIVFIKDNNSFIKVSGNYNNVADIFNIQENQQVSFPNFLYPNHLDTDHYLQVEEKGNRNDSYIEKTEIHYSNLRKIFFANSIPSYLGYPYTCNVHSDVPVSEDTLDMYIFGNNESVFEVNTQRLNLLPMFSPDWRFHGHSHSVYISNPFSSSSVTYHGWDLLTDTTKIDLYIQNGSYATFEVNTSDFLEIDVRFDPSQTIPCYIKYKGSPTILNHNSSDSRVVLINSN